MSRVITANGQYFESTSLPAIVPPFTMSCWFMPPAVTASYVLMALCTDGTQDNRHNLGANGAATGDPIEARSRIVTSSSVAQTSTSFVADVWQHACGVWAATNSRTAYLNGGGKVTQTTTREPTGMDRYRIGAQGDTTNSALRGRICEPAFWVDALNDEEVAALAAGACPLDIRPSALVRFSPIFDGASLVMDFFGFPLTVVGTMATADHAPVSAPTRMAS